MKEEKKVVIIEKVEIHIHSPDKKQKDDKKTQSTEVKVAITVAIISGLTTIASALIGR